MSLVLWGFQCLGCRVREGGSAGGARVLDVSCGVLLGSDVGGCCSAESAIDGVGVIRFHFA